MKSLTCSFFVNIALDILRLQIKDVSLQENCDVKSYK